MDNKTTLELTATEKRHLIGVLNDRYEKSVNLFEVSSLKSIMEKLGVRVKDWVPPLPEKTKDSESKDIIAEE